MNAPIHRETGFVFDNSYARLPERFYARLPPTSVSKPKLLRLNEGLCETLGLDPAQLAAPEGTETFAGNRVPSGADPIAMAYAGHQFGNFVPQLGDGRAILLGEIIGRDGIRYDIHLKGSGRTPFSRGGDGRAVIGPVLREYIVSEAMFRLGIPTTRSLAAVGTGEQVMREQPMPGAVLTRVAKSHVRVGTFQYFAARGDELAIRILADYVIERHYPEAEQADDPYLALLQAVIERQAELVAAWTSVGFIHGVMNTDNMQIAGETIDYGPCAFMDFYHPDTVYSSIDMMGRYAFANQPRIAQWNLAQLAQCLLPLLQGDEQSRLEKAQMAITGFVSIYDEASVKRMRRKLGLRSERPEDQILIDDLLTLMRDNRADFTLTFRLLSDAADGTPIAVNRLRDLFAHTSELDDWLERWRRRIDDGIASPDKIANNLRAVNPLYMPRNHLVEQALNDATHGDMTSFEALLVVLASPFEQQPGRERYTLPPQPHEEVLQTFCGT